MHESPPTPQEAWRIWRQTLRVDFPRSVGFGDVVPREGQSAVGQEAADPVKTTTTTRGEGGGGGLAE